MDTALNTISLIEKGNQHAFQSLVYQYSDQLLLFAIGFVKSHEVAEEIVSDAFVNLWRQRARIFEIRDVKSYLYITVRNASISHLRKISGRKEICIDNLEAFHSLPVIGPETDEFTDEILEQINRAIDQLPPKCKLVFTLAKVQGLKYKEISEILGISVKTINNHIANGLAAIAHSLNETQHLENERFRRIIASFLF